MDKPYILLVNGPNLNLLGKREEKYYGKVTLNKIEEQTGKILKEAGFSMESFQSNIEGEIVSFIQREGFIAQGMLINAGAYTHTSVAIRDAILTVGIPFVEVHLSNIYKREAFRHHSYLTDIAVGIISGFGEYSYTLAVEAMIGYLNKNQGP